MKTASGLLSVFLVTALILSRSVDASGTGTAAGEEKAGQEGSGEALSAAADSTAELFVPLTEKTSKSLVFPLTEEQAAMVRETSMLSSATPSLPASSQKPLCGCCRGERNKLMRRTNELPITAINR
jgi:hypothetical protein